MPFSRRVVLQSAALAIATVVLSSPVSSVLAVENHKVIIKDFAFHPTELKIKQGDTVEWRNIDGFIHTATSDNNDLFDTKTITTGESAFHTFNSNGVIGEIPYHCDVYPMIKAKIIVEE